MTDPQRIMLDRVGAAARHAADRVLEQADPALNLGDLIDEALRAGAEAGAEVFGDFLLYGTTPPPRPPRPPATRHSGGGPGRG